MSLALFAIALGKGVAATSSSTSAFARAPSLGRLYIVSVLLGVEVFWYMSGVEFRLEPEQPKMQ
jgi:hypothetical protein